MAAHEPTTRPRHPWPRRIARWLFIPVTVYAAWCAILWFKQDGMIFPGQLAGTGAGHTAPADAETWELTIKSPRATMAPTTVEAWFFLGDGCSPEHPGPAVLIFHGNADLIDHWTDIAQEYTSRGVSVLLCEFRGYGRSTGTPSQRALVHDACAFHDMLAARPEVRTDAIIAHGRSLGAGVAAQLALRRPIAALVLDEAFTSVASFAAGYGVPAFVVKHPFRTDVALRTFKGTVLITHGTRDTTIPFSHGRALASLRPDATFIELPADHFNFPGDDAKYWGAIDEFLRRSGIRGAAGDP